MGWAGLLAATVVVCWLVVLSVFDLRVRRLPNWLTLPGAGVVLLVAMLAGHGGHALAGSAGLAACYALVHLFSRGGLGAGDVKLALGVGALTGVFGADVWLLAALAAPVLTGVWATVAVVLGDRRPVPHGPSMCVATVGVLGLVVL